MLRGKISPGKWIQSENHFPTTCTFFGILSWYCNLFLLIHIICSHKKIIYLISAWLKHPFTIPLITYFKKPSNDLLHGKLNICWSAWKPQVLRTKSDVIFEGVIITANHSLRSNHKNRWNGVKNTTSRCAILMIAWDWKVSWRPSIHNSWHVFALWHIMLMAVIRRTDSANENISGVKRWMSLDELYTSSSQIKFIHAQGSLTGEKFRTRYE